MLAFDKKICYAKDIDMPRTYANKLFNLLRNKAYVYSCTPLKGSNTCDTCEERFRCFTNNGTVPNLAKLITRGGWNEEYDEEEYEESLWAYNMAAQFCKEHPNKYIYVVRIADGGEGGDEIESELRTGEYFGDIPFTSWE